MATEVRRFGEGVPSLELHAVVEREGVAESGLRRAHVTWRGVLPGDVFALDAAGPGWVASGRSHRGHVRERNDDQLLVHPRGVFAVADGCGGLPAGGDAASCVVDAVREACDVLRNVSPARLLSTALLAAHNRVRLEARGPRAGMGSTVVAAALDGGVLTVAHAGDSRCYLRTAKEPPIGGRHLVQLTEDHNLLRAYLAQGHPPSKAVTMYYPEALTHYAGMDEPFEPTVNVYGFPVLPGDVVLLSTDGLHGALAEAVVASALAYPDAADALLRKVLDSAAGDNATLVVVRVLG